MSRFFCSKKYGHEEDSLQRLTMACNSHCRFMHGYSLEFEFFSVQIN